MLDRGSEQYVGVSDGRGVQKGVQAGESGQAWVVEGRSWALSRTFGRLSVRMRKVVGESFFLCAISGPLPLAHTIRCFDQVIRPDLRIPVSTMVRISLLVYLLPNLFNISFASLSVEARFREIRAISSPERKALLCGPQCTDMLRQVGSREIG